MENIITIYLFCVVGVMISILLPILRQALPRPANSVAGIDGILPRIINTAKPYMALGLFSLVVAALVLAVFYDSLTDWRAAILAGYTADSTLQKLK